MISSSFLPSRNGLAAVAAVVLGALAGSAQAATIPVPNGSFESPMVDTQVAPAYPFMPPWFDAPIRAGYSGTAQDWDNLTGVFPNTASNDPAYISNMDGNQSAYLFASKGAGVFQDLSTTFQLGVSYDLALALRGGGYMGFPLLLDGTTLEIGLYYRDGGNNIVRIGGTTVTYNSAATPYGPVLHDYHFTLGPVQAADAWAGKAIGIEILSTVASDQSGYWDMDNVRLQTVPEPSILALLPLALAGLACRRPRSRP